MSNISLQTLEFKDWPLLRTMRIRAATLHPTLFYDTPQTATDRPSSHWQNLLSAEGNKFWALYDGTTCVGTNGALTVTEDKSGQTAMIGYTFIERAYRGKALTEIFCKAALDHALQYEKWKKLVTDHRDGNEVSRKLILRYGFCFTEKVMINWPDGSRDYELRYDLDLEKLRARSQ